jgi:hypothetical protein
MNSRVLYRRLRKWLFGRDRYNSAVSNVSLRLLGIMLARVGGLTPEGEVLAARLDRHWRRLGALKGGVE